MLDNPEKTRQLQTPLKCEPVSWFKKSLILNPTSG
jgi:hypothetical protein